MYDPISREQQLHVEDLTLADVAADVAAFLGAPRRSPG